MLFRAFLTPCSHSSVEETTRIQSVLNTEDCLQCSLLEASIIST
jgi:hypothetical protein